jgi:aryl-alcohol dehydrogenase-like predicted oxidoreductase
MQQRALGPFSVSAIGLGCMNFCHAYGPAVPEAQAERVLLAALDAGVTHFDTAALYGFGVSEELIGKFLSQHRSRFTLASKCGLIPVTQADGSRVRAIDGRPESIKATCEGALKRLRTDVIDLYYLHRWDKKVPIEESVGALADLIQAGKIRAIGLSEVSAETLLKGHAEHPIAALQTEYSMWTRNPELGTLEACREIGAAFVAFSPVGRGFLTSAPPDPRQFDDKDIRKTMPRFMGDAYSANLDLHPALRMLADEAGCTPAQLAIAWLLHKAPHILPLPGTTSVDHLHEDLGAADVSLDEGLMASVDELINTHTVTGNRYPAQARSEVDTEEIPGT